MFNYYNKNVNSLNRNISGKKKRDQHAIKSWLIFLHLLIFVDDPGLSWRVKNINDLHHLLLKDTNLFFLFGKDKFFPLCYAFFNDHCLLNAKNPRFEATVKLSC